MAWSGWPFSCWYYMLYQSVPNLHHLTDAWWRHQMETFSASLALCAGNSPVTGEFPAQRPVTWSFVFFDLCLNKRLSKQSWGWWCETPSGSLWRQCNASFQWLIDLYLCILSPLPHLYIMPSVLSSTWLMVSSVEWVPSELIFSPVPAYINFELCLIPKPKYICQAFDCRSQATCDGENVASIYFIVAQ